MVIKHMTYQSLMIVPSYLQSLTISPPSLHSPVTHPQPLWPHCLSCSPCGATCIRAYHVHTHIPIHTYIYIYNTSISQIRYSKHRKYRTVTSIINNILQTCVFVCTYIQTYSVSIQPNTSFCPRLLARILRMS